MIKKIVKRGIMKRFGFTLAEVLITLGIIGVVTAITLPVLINNYKEKATVTRLKKVYSILSQAMQKAVIENGTADVWDSYETEDDDDTLKLYYSDNIIKQLAVAKDCGFKSEGCFLPHGYKMLSGREERDFENMNNLYYKLVLADGTLVAIQGYSATRADGCAASGSCGEIWVDINGNKHPNVVGKDLFIFLYTKDNVFPYGYNKKDKPLSESGCSVKSGNGYGCAAWILTNENMDYLHCNDLNWSTKTTCK